MRMRLLFLAILLADLGCGGLQRVDLKTSVGGELRGHTDHTTDCRTSIGTGPEFSFRDGQKVSLTYRNRLTDMEPDTMEHGIFLSASVPIWRSK